MINFRERDWCTPALAKVCKRKQERTRSSIQQELCFVCCFSLLQSLGAVLIPWEQRMPSSQRKGSVITITAVIRVLICSETAQQQHMGVLLLSPPWRLGEFIFLCFFLQTIKNIDKLVRFYQKGLGF